MEIEELLSIISTTKVPDVPNTFSLFRVNDAVESYYGKDSEGHVVFIIPSNSKNPNSHSRSSSLISLSTDINCHFEESGEYRDILSNILVCKSDDDTIIMSFVRMCRSFAYGDVSTQAVQTFFSSLQNIFSNNHKIDKNTLNGFFAELYTILYMKDRDVDLWRYWQKRDYMKFDFMIDTRKRIDVKSTTLSSRIHHFLHEQLMNEDYDVIIISILLRESNTGISLYDVAQRCREIYASDTDRLSLIENKLVAYSDEELKNIVFDLPYLENNIHIVDAENIKKFGESTPVGVYKPEYDSDLSYCSTKTIEEFKQWLLMHD